MTTGPRSEIKFHDAPRDGFGSSRHWHRTLNGRHYRFTAVLMPDGERRYFASRYDGPAHMHESGATFACDWTPVFSFTVKSEGK